jgi:Uma2 family endonuclease
METTLIHSAYEIERGKPMPSLNHSIVQGNLYFLLRTKYGNQFRYLPEIRLSLAEHEVVPDLAICENIDFVADQDKIRLTETPLCAIEILSPKQHLADLMIKSKIYLENGVKSYWLIIPELRSVYVFDAMNEFTVFVKEEILEDKILHIELDLKEIFS